MKKWYCILTNGKGCWFSFNEGEDNNIIEGRKYQHEKWHKACGVQKRNNTEGVVEWLLK